MMGFTKTESSLQDFSLNIVLILLKLYNPLENIRMEGIVSQIFLFRP